MKIFALGAAIAAVSTGSAFAGVTTNFGTLTDSLGNPISFDAGEGNSNTNFIYSHHDTADTGTITMGLSTQTHYGSANGPITNNGVETFYAQAGANQSGSGEPGSSRWAFKWSVTADTTDGVPNDLYMALRIDGPSGGSWGSIDYSSLASEIVDYPGSAGTTANQQVWLTSYDFMQLDSEDSGVTAGLWDGMGYDFNELGTYTFQIRVWEKTGDSYDEVGTLAMNVEVVPGVGGLAALGGLGLVGRRRRR